MEAVVIRGISLERDQAKVTLNDVPDVPGTAFRVFRALGDADVNVDMIVQNTSREGRARISFTCHRNDVKRAQTSLAPVLADFPGSSLEEETGIVKLSAVGIGMRSHSGVAADMFAALAQAGISIMMISTSEIKVSCVIAEKYTELAVRSLHTAFALDKANQPAEE